MAVLTITVRRRLQRVVDGVPRDAWPVVIEWRDRRDGRVQRREADLALDPKVRERPEPEPRDYGVLLGKAVFVGAVRDGFLEALAGAGPGERVHVLLDVEADEWKALRWERLAAPAGQDDPEAAGGTTKWRPLALRPETPFAFHLPGVTSVRYDPITRSDLKALVVVASPSPSAGPAGWPSPSGSRGEWNHARTVADLEATFQTLGIAADYLVTAEGVKVRGRVLGPPMINTLCGVLAGGAYTILHVAGHGRYVRGEDPVIYLLRAADEGRDTTPWGAPPYYALDPVPATTLLDRLRLARGRFGLPHLVFLSVCESAYPGSGAAPGGMAQRLVREIGTPAVVGMTDRVAIRTADALACAFYPHLFEHGEPDRALVQAFSGLAGEWDVGEELVPVLCSCLAGGALFTIPPDAPPAPDVIDRGLGVLDEYLPTRAHVLGPEFRRLSDEWQSAKATWPERKALFGALNALFQEVFDRNFHEVVVEGRVPPDDPRCPFRGLEPFNPFRERDRKDSNDRPADDVIFFTGRQALVDGLVKRLEGYPFLALLGNSGTGKSSLALAGVVTSLAGKEPPPGRRPAIMTPGGAPRARLARELAAAGPDPLVLVVDRFEEVFTQCHDDGERAGFFNDLLARARGTRVLVTMRSEFLGDCARHVGLREALTGHSALIPPMDLEALREAMTAQADLVGLRFDPGLVGTILHDLEDQPDPMPLLQHALRELWNRRHGTWLRALEYDNIGGVAKAIARTADAALADLVDDRERDRALDLFVRLTRVDQPAPADGPPRAPSAAPAQLPLDVHWRLPLGELVPEGATREQTRALVNALADSHLLATTTRDGDGETEVAVAHDALIKHWDTLQRRVGNDRRRLWLRQEIGRQADEWDKAGQPNDRLERNVLRLRSAESLLHQTDLTLTETEGDFIRASVALRDWEERRNHLALVAGLAIALFLLTVATAGWFFAWSNGQELAAANTSLGDRLQQVRATSYARELARGGRALAVGAQPGAGGARGHGPLPPRSPRARLRLGPPAPPRRPQGPRVPEPPRGGRRHRTVPRRQPARHRGQGPQAAALGRRDG
jgi:hypothetical protein